MATHAFADPVFDAQRMFRAAMNALSRPGTPMAVDAGCTPPAPLTPELAGLALTLADHETPVWLDSALAASDEVRDYLRFHTGAPIVSEAADAVFALISDTAACARLTGFAQGEPDFPDRSATLLMAAACIEDRGPLVLSGPGIAGQSHLHVAPLPPDFPAQWAENHDAFPLGVDIIFAAPGLIAGLPRSTLVREG
jgi:alpha-D-ribose 1-methylphosphonate 5-triphosphate synthase subunit PhnH